MKRLVLISLMALLISPVIGQSKKYPLTAGLIGGLTEYSGDLGRGMYHFKDANPFAGLYFGCFVSPHIDFAFNTSYGRFSFKEPKNLKFDSKQFQANTNFRIKILDSETHKIVPFLLIGIGVAHYSGYSLKTTDGGKDVPYLNGNGTDVFIPFGAGVQFRLTERFNLFEQETFAYSDHDDRDGAENDLNDGFVMHTIGLSYNFSLLKDEDKDGVTDKKDKCPKTPKGIAVDVKGCPLDRDNDGIADYLDSCPDIKGMLSAHGCPDADGDSITDKDDKCPDAYGLAKMNGCPDKDDDGITDAEDGCPAEKGTLAMHGCPDRDFDNVPDKDDACPDVAGIVANKGCPEVKEEVKKVIADLQGIQFETGRDIIMKSSYYLLNNVVEVLKQHPEYKLSIEGHTDNTGDPEKNMDLSSRRANAAMKYLIDNNIDAARLRAKGFGSTIPVDTNDTDAGRAKNRRVEFKLEF